jgi:ABC-type Fe3+/spermidine/putrescine transport system ATPase subunit
MLRLEALTKRFGSTVAVDELSLEVGQGEFLSLLGPSGCGKTTTLRMIAGFESPTAGRIELAGGDVTRLPPQRRGMGMVFQNYALFPHLDVFENVAFGLRTRRIGRKDLADRVTAVLKRVDLGGYERRRIQELSGGQQQRVALARALAPEPPVLLLDEPLSNLDASLRERTRTELRSLLKRLGITAVFVTHDQEEAFALSDRIAVMHAGRLEQIDVPETLYAQPATAFVAGFLGRASFLPGRLLEPEGDGWACEVAGRTRWRVTAAPELPDPAKGDRVRLLLRPESLRMIPPDGTAAHALDGVVSERRFFGATTHYVVQTFGSEVLLAAPPDAATPGARVRLRLEGTVFAYPRGGG